MQIVRESLEAVLRKTDTAVVAEVLSVSAPRQEAFSRSIELEVVATKTLFGNQKVGRKIRCRYAEGVPHVRGDVHVSPLVTGSGLEMNVQPGRRVVLLLAAPATGGRSRLRDVLRIEPLESAPLIEAERKQPRSD